MSASPAKAPARASVSGRRVPRYSVAVPVDVTVSRSGVAQRIPGRSVDVSEGGIAAVLAGELLPGESVRLEFRLPYLGVPLRINAMVRHQVRLRCGLEFSRLSPEQLGMISYWAKRTQVESENQFSVPGSQFSETAARKPRPSNRSQRALWITLAVFTVVCGVGWWQWHRAWNELESHLPRKQVTSDQARIKVPAEMMEQLVTHKVEPVYPEAARQANLQGVVVLNAVIGRDGTVLKLRPVAGPDALAPAAVDAVKWWRFQPYRVNGKPVEVETTLAVEFRSGP
jgi:TonB family protein